MIPHEMAEFINSERHIIKSLIPPTNTPTKPSKTYVKSEYGSALKLERGCVPLLLECTEAVARCLLVTGYDYVQARLYFASLAPDEICSLRRTSHMTIEHLQNCIERKNLPGVTSTLYCEA
ncbi:hypothetical protein NPIL_359511 [Nephila pilipes]|uniref:Uncharacterized protein n=1 Tax=Nephila pilipes TaxID=299642 RepID=A0A8X6TUQ9_NEPPI|nr:hypothetical protein NPIL_359511 [Nephila pilipes]